MVCLGLEPGAAGWKAQTNPLSYGGTPQDHFVCLSKIVFHSLSLIVTYYVGCRLDQSFPMYCNIKVK